MKKNLIGFGDRKNVRQGGFALVKTVMAITLLSFSLTISVQLLGFSAKSIQQNGHRTKAVFYAQQCMEWTRNIRDTAWKQNLPWDCGLTPDLISTETEWEMAIKRSSDTSGTCLQPLGYKISSDVSSESLIEDTIFSRKVQVQKDGDNSLKIHCEISWPEGSLGMDQILTNWKK